MHTKNLLERNWGKKTLTYYKDNKEKTTKFAWNKSKVVRIDNLAPIAIDVNLETIATCNTCLDVGKVQDWWHVHLWCVLDANVLAMYHNIAETWNETVVKRDMLLLMLPVLL